MTSPICYIFGAGEFSPGDSAIKLEENDLVIAADGGYDHLLEAGLRADIALGDFDSVSSSEIWEDTICEKMTYPPEKDDTDMMLAIKLGLSKGFEQFAIYGGLGGRLDHSLANIQALAYLAEHRAQGILYHREYELTVIRNGSFTIPKDFTGCVSVFSLSDMSKNVSIKGLQYETEGTTLTNSFPLGISNIAAGKKGIISVESGTLLILWHKSTVI